MHAASLGMLSRRGADPQVQWRATDLLELDESPCQISCRKGCREIQLQVICMQSVYETMLSLVDLAIAMHSAGDI